MTSPTTIMNHLSEAKHDGHDDSVLLDLWEAAANAVVLVDGEYTFEVTTDGHVLLLILTKGDSDELIYAFELTAQQLKDWIADLKVNLIRSDNNEGYIHLCEYKNKLVLTVGQDQPLSIRPMAKFYVPKSTAIVLKRLALTIIES